MHEERPAIHGRGDLVGTCGGSRRVFLLHRKDFSRRAVKAGTMQQTRTFQLHYPLERLTEPVVTRLVTDFDLTPNLLRADVDAHKGGWLVLGLAGDAERIESALNWLRGHGLTVVEVN